MAARTRSRWPAVAALLALVLVATACGDDGTPGEGQTPGDEATTPEGPPFRVALVAPSATNDLAFTQSMVESLNALKDEYNLEIAVTDNMFVVEDAAAAIRDYATQDYDLVLAHGSQYGGSLEEIAPDFPDVSFAWGTSVDTFGLDNVFSYTTRADEGAFVQGQMAAALTQSGVMGVVGPIEVGDAKLYVDGFVNGAKAQDPDVDVEVNYIGSFSDVALASEAAQAFVSDGADVMTGTAQMVVGAVSVSSQNQVAWFGTQANQTSLDPAGVVSSQVYHWGVAVEPIIQRVLDGTLGGEVFTIDLENDGLVIEFNPDYPLPDEVRQIGEDVITGIKDGSISTGVAPEE